MSPLCQVCELAQPCGEQTLWHVLGDMALNTRRPLLSSAHWRWAVHSARLVPLNLTTAPWGRDDRWLPFADVGTGERSKIQEEVSEG